MEFRYLLLGFSLMIFLFSGFGNLSAQECSYVGETSGGSYCDAYGEFHLLKNSGDSCLNDYECENGKCIEEMCQSGRFPSITEKGNTLSKIWEFFSGEQCDPSIETEYFCEGTIAFLCGQNHVWEEKGEIPGVCGVPLGDDGDEDQGDNGGNTPGDSGGSGPSPKIVIISPKEGVTYSSRAISLEVIDLKQIAKYWRYSLNQDSKVEFKPNTTINVNEGQNSLRIYTSRYSSFASEQDAYVRFNVVQTSSAGYCGDNICGVGESCSVCSGDCGSCLPEITSYCGDGFCESDESSATCSLDCTPWERKDRMWLFYTIVSVLFVSIGLLGFFIVRRVKRLRKPQIQQGKYF